MERIRHIMDGGKRPKTLASVALLVLSLYLVYWIYGALLTAPHQHLFTDKGDGFKNYYTYLYHIRYDSHPLAFEGMNYPYGEHVVYTDAQPLFSGVLNLVAGLWPGVADQAAGWMNLLLLLSLPLAALLLFRIFLRLNFNLYLSACCALGLTFLSPQALRMPFYFGLAYHWIVPAGIWLFLWAGSGGRARRRSLWIGLYVFLCGWIHPYWATLLGGMFLVMALVQHRVAQGNWRETGWRIGLRAVLPLLLFFLLVKITDSHANRNATPTGFFEFSATPSSVFLPGTTAGTVYAPFFDKPPEAEYDHWEGRAYVGIVGNLSLLILIALLALAVFRRRWDRLQALLPPPVRIIVWTGVCFLPLAFALPFAIPGFEFLLDFVPPVKQFRSIGRFALVFYFAVGILSVAVLDHFLKRIRRDFRDYAALGAGLLAATCMWIEGLPLHQTHLKNFGYTRNVLNRKVVRHDTKYAFLEEALQAVNPDHYQAIVPLPWFHIGSEAMAPPIDCGFNQFQYASAFSYHTGLPMTAVYASRTSLDETRKSFRFFDQPLLPRRIRDDFPNPKPLLTFSYRGLPLHPNERRIRNIGTKVFENERVELWALPFDALWAVRSNAVLDGLGQTLGTSLFAVGDFWATDSLASIYFNDFEGPYKDLFNQTGIRGKKTNRQAYRGKQCWTAPYKGQHILLKLDELPGNWVPGKKYTLRFWYQHEENRTSNTFSLGRLAEDGKIHRAELCNNIYRNYTVDDGWTLCEWEFEYPRHPKRFVFYFQGQKYSQDIYVDDVWLSPSDVAAYRILESRDGKILRALQDDRLLHR